MLTYRDGGDASRQRRAGHGDHRGEESRAPGARAFSSIAAAPSPKARRARAASTCCCPATIRRAPIGSRAISRRRASKCGAPKKPFKVGDRQLPAGTYLVSHAQPTGRLIRNLLDPKTDQPEDFIKRQEERRARRQPRSDLRHHRVEPADALRRRARRRVPPPIIVRDRPACR